jgi:CRISPR system Cascade subunit CasC
VSEPRNVFVEFHVLTSHVPANLNRDDLGSPKTAVFGGVRRLRISSQCLKRTWRRSPWFRDELGDELLGVRSQLITEEILKELEKRNVPTAGARAYIDLLAGIGKKAKASQVSEDEDEASTDTAEPETQASSTAAPDSYKVPPTRHLLFLSRQEIAALVDLGAAKAPELDDLAAKAQEKDGKGKATKNAKAAEKELQKRRDGLLKSIGEALAQASPQHAVDIALFGRFVTADEIESVDAALQVAHAIGTGEVVLETDYFSAVDDLNIKTTGAGHIGDTELASAVFYKYACCDLGLLLKSLDGDDKLAGRVFGALTQAIARAVPTGKKNSTAPQNPADYITVVVRPDAPMSLANAFVNPIRPRKDKDVMTGSIEALRSYAQKLDTMYGAGDLIGRHTLSSQPLGEMLSNERSIASLAELSQQVAALVETHASGGRR